jgi:hypothetical protein
LTTMMKVKVKVNKRRQQKKKTRKRKRGNGQFETEAVFRTWFNRFRLSSAHTKVAHYVTSGLIADGDDAVQANKTIEERERDRDSRSECEAPSTDPFERSKA